jgi:LuxR family maltose regulon positive regulatory protein
MHAVVDKVAGREGDAIDGADPTLQAEVQAMSAVIAGLDDDSRSSLELGRAAAASPAAMPLRSRRFAETAQVFGLIYEGRFDEVRRIRTNAPPPAEDGEAPPLYAGVYRETMFGLSALVEGRLVEAVQIFESALARAESAVGRQSAAAVVPAGYLASLHYERDDLARTHRMVSERTAIAMEACPLGSLLRYCRGAASLYAKRRDLGSALAVLEEAREVAAARQWLRLRAACDAEAVRLFLREGRLDQARKIADELQLLMPAQVPAPMGSFLETWTSACIVRARLELATDRSQDAAARLADLRGRLAAAGMAHLEACASLLLALALEQSGALEAALEPLTAALRYARPNGMVNSFIDEGEPMRLLLSRWRDEHAQRADIEADFYCDRLLASFEPAAGRDTDAHAQRAASSLLSVREVEILDHISQGLSNKEIGRALRVAPETIKWHLKNIFEKLNVGSRVEAVQAGLQRPRK